MYFCKLVRKVLIVDSFYREGSGAEAVRADLESFQWPKGRWVIEEVRCINCRVGSFIE